MKRYRILSLAVFVVSVLVLIGAEWASPTKHGSRILTVERHILKMYGDVIEAFQKEHGRLPRADEGLRERSADRSIPLDSWNHPYIYRRTDTAPGYEIYSAGINGVDEHGKGDDVTTWKKTYTCKDYGVDCPPNAMEITKMLALGSAALSLLVFLVCSLISLLQRLRRPGHKDTGHQPPSK